MCDRAQTKKGGKSIAQFPKVRLNFWLFVAKNTAPGTQNPFAFLFPSELLLNCWAQLIVNYTQQAPTITSIEENVHHMPDHKCLFPTGVTSFLNKNLFILFLMMLAPIFFFFFLIRHYLKQRMWKTTAVVLGRRIRIASSLDQFERQIFSDIKIFHNRENCRAFCTSLPKNSMMNAPDLMQNLKEKNLRI